MDGRTALVTGAARGLGLGIAQSLHSNGMRVVLTDVDLELAKKSAMLIDPSGETASAAEVDVRERRSIERAFEDALARWGHVDVMVNNAARTLFTSVWDVEADEWDDVLAVNLRGTLFGCQVAGPHMRANGWGRIVNVASVSGQLGVGGAHYAASKAGIIVLTKTVAADLAPYGVTVNAIAPHAIEGPMLRTLPAEQIDSIAEAVPVGRVGRPEEIGALVSFLASEDAGYITGATYDINGGVLMR